MSDFNSQLPIRTQNNGDVVVQLVDGTVTSQKLAIAADGSIAITDNGGTLTVDGTVELGATTLAALETITVTATNLDIRDLAFATDKVDVGGSSVELGATTLAALESITVQNGAGGSAVNIQDGGNSLTVDAVDLDIRNLTATDVVTANIKDATGTAFSTSNPLPVIVSSSTPGDEINDYSTAAAVAGGATSNHDYTVTALKTLLLTQIEASASGKMKIEVQVESGVASGSFATKFVQFNSTATPNMSIKLSQQITVAAGVRVRIIRTNKDGSAMDLYSSICGVEI
jgi:hypothetical protein